MPMWPRHSTLSPPPASALMPSKTFAPFSIGAFRVIFNPRRVSGIKKSPQKSRDRVLNDDELARVWRAAQAIGYPYGTIVQLLILVGQRSGETAALQWDWIVDDTITIPASVTKNARATTFPIGPMTQALIRTIPRLGPLLFPARGYIDRPFRGFGVSKIALDTCGVKKFHAPRSPAHVRDEPCRARHANPRHREIAQPHLRYDLRRRGGL